MREYLLFTFFIYDLFQVSKYIYSFELVTHKEEIMLPSIHYFFSTYPPVPAQFNLFFKTLLKL